MRVAEGFTAILDAVAADPENIDAQAIAAAFLNQTRGRALEHSLAQWVARLGSGNFVNGATLLIGLFGDHPERYALFACLAPVAFRLGLPDLALRLFEHCLTEDLPAAAGPEEVEAQYRASAADYDHTRHHDQSVRDFLGFLHPHLGEGWRGDVVDLPCGTGLAGPALRPLAGRLIGSDLSAAMLELAAGRGCYDQLIAGDMVAVLAGLRADLVVCHGALYYVPDLAPITAAAAAALRPGGHFAFTDYHAGRGVMATMGGTRRFCRSPDLVRRIMADHGLVERAAKTGLTYGALCRTWLFAKA